MKFIVKVAQFVEHSVQSILSTLQTEFFVHLNTAYRLKLHVIKVLSMVCTLKAP